MLERWTHRLTGWVRVEVRGEPGRLVTLAARRGVRLWDFRRQEGGGSLCCRPREYRRLREPAKRCGVWLRARERGGLPFRLRPLRRRPGLVAGALLAVGLVGYLGSFVWGVKVVGNQTLGDRLILDAARECGVWAGAPRGSFVPKEAAHRLVGKLPELEWASVNTDGCFAQVSVREGEARPETRRAQGWSNLVAARAGVIVSVGAQQGRPEVAPGQTVEEGDLLIAGLFREKLDPWSPRKEAYQQAGAARGTVLARTAREFTVHVSGVREMTVTGPETERVTLELFGLRAPGNVCFPPAGETVSTVRRWPLTLLGVELPAAVEVEKIAPVTVESRQRTEEELRRDALWKLRQVQRAQLPPGSRVEREELEWAFPDGMCLLTARCVCLEDIGVVREVLVKETESDNNF